MNTKILLGLTLAAVLVMTVASPAIAEAITGIKKTEIKVKGDEINKLKFHLDDKVEKPTFGGYAIFTDGGAVVAYTSHPGVYDSTSQTAPTSDQVDIQFGAIAAICGASPDVACGDEWHSHLVVPDTDSPFCNFAAISELSYNEPANKVKAGGKHVEGKDIALGDGGFVGAISGELTTWTVGEPLQPGTPFDLNAAVSDAGLQAICILDVDESGLLCQDLGTGTHAEASVYVNTHNVFGGDADRTEITEFPYNNSIWTDANVNQGLPLGILGVGAGEWVTWYGDNCVAAP